MASFKNLVDKKIALFDRVPEDMATQSEKAQLQIWKKIRPLLDDMDVDLNGNITQSDSNVNRIGIIVEELNRVIAGSEYKDAVKSFLGSIDEGVNLTNEIAIKIQSSFEPTNAQLRLLEISRNNAINAFFGSGLRERVTQPFLEQLTANVAARAPLRDAVKALELVMVGDENVDGRLLANVKTSAITAQSIADRSYSASVNETIGVQWYEYVGGIIPTTRNFCSNREDGIYHVKEIEQWGAGKNSAGIEDIFDGTWAGRINGTDRKSIFTFVGGWNCRHQFMPVLEQDVPPEVILRATKEGFYKK